jgi:hypothetical protein
MNIAVYNHCFYSTRVASEKHCHSNNYSAKFVTTKLLLPWRSCLALLVMLPPCASVCAVDALGLINQGFRYLGLCSAFKKFTWSHADICSKFKCVTQHIAERILCREHCPESEHHYSRPVTCSMVLRFVVAMDITVTTYSLIVGYVDLPALTATSS